LTVLETGACGVPNVIADAGAPPEYAAPFSILVPPAARVLGATGMRAFIDEGLAVDALTRLAADRDLRVRLGQNARAVAIAHRWESVVPAWDRLLAELSPPDRRAIHTAP
jgi:glycosyltransferase involved in cell wall biosynthesis